jgi:hypothetical protein
MSALRRSMSCTLLLGACLLIGLGAAQTSPAAPSSRDTRLPCAVYDTSIGEYGAFVFRLRKEPGACVEYVGNKPCHCTEADLTRIRWHHWGSGVTRATATWHYCGMDTCIYRRAHLVASRKRFTCHVPVYTRLRLFVAAHGRGLDSPRPSRTHYNLPACPTVFDET